MEHIVAISKEAKVVVGTFVDDIDLVKKWIERGVQCISFSVDVSILYEASRRIVKELSKIHN
jgi:2-keto-3-deoxy-L-rhamnonate aldolase RhmA